LLLRHGITLALAPWLQILIETNTRNKKKMVTTVSGLELFGIKLADASKAFGKKFACGASVTKSATGAEQIDMQVRDSPCDQAEYSQQ
jgi:density-regulated protein DRP1